jgi:hypothetical protein
MMKNKLIFLLMCFILFALAAASQDVVLWEKVNKNTGIPEKGINSSRYNHFYVGWGLNMGLLENETTVRIPSSNDYFFGYRQIYKLSNYFAAGFQLTFGKSMYSILQDGEKNVHDSILHKKEMYLINQGDFSVYLRLNFDRRRGAYMGHFLDLGSWGGYNFMRRRMIEDVTDYESRIRVWYKDVSYIEKFQYGVYASLGINRYVFFARYRISDLFDSAYNFSQLPALTFGFEVGFHK